MAVATMAIATQAATITWGNASGDFLVKDKDGTSFYNGSNGSGVTPVSANLSVYFINDTYLASISKDVDDLLAIIAGGGSISSYASTTLTGNSAIAMTPGVLNGASFSFTYDDSKPSAPNMANTGDEFFVLMITKYFEDVSNPTEPTYYYQIVTSPDWASTVDVNAGAVGNPSSTFSWANADATPWQPIPEPLTVGLALAGVALLIAQRKRK